MTKIQEQENKDYSITKQIMTKIFKAYDATATLSQMPQFSHFDATMDVTKGNIFKQYTVEIKERNVTSLEDLETLPLKVKKYCNIMSHSNNKTPLVIYLVNGEEYYIFDLNKLDLNKVRIANWNIPKVQYSDKHQYEEQPTFFIPLNQSIYNGTYANYQQKNHTFAEKHPQAGKTKTILKPPMEEFA